MTGALREACRGLDHDQAAVQVEQLIGWGEALTPAEDDFVVGLCAALNVLVQGDRRRRRFRDILATSATSGADTVSGLLAGLAAWAEPASVEAAA